MGLCKDRFLLELFIVQRKYMNHKYEVTKIVNNDPSIYDFDYYMIYYYGYAITNYEYRYIYNVMKELDERELSIFLRVIRWKMMMKSNRI